MTHGLERIYCSGKWRPRFRLLKTSRKKHLENDLLCICNADCGSSAQQTVGLNEIIVQNKQPNIGHSWINTKMARTKIEGQWQ